MNKIKRVSPSILSADFAKLGAEIEMVTLAGADLIHVDVMDGHFVTNLTIGMNVVKSIKPVSKIPLDVHLMIEKPEKYIREFIKSGSDYLTIHIESTTEMEKNLKLIRELGCKAGITLRPKTNIEEVKKYLNLVDLVLVMTVEPGFGGQSFMHDQVEKIKTLKAWRDEGLGNYLIEVDGGVDSATSKICWDAGADVLVAGSAVFKGEKTIENYKKNIQSLK